MLREVKLLQLLSLCVARNFLSSIAESTTPKIQYCKFMRCVKLPKRIRCSISNFSVSTTSRISSLQLGNFWKRANGRLTKTRGDFMGLQIIYLVRYMVLFLTVLSHLLKLCERVVNKQIKLSQYKIFMQEMKISQ